MSKDEQDQNMKIGMRQLERARTTQAVGGAIEQALNGDKTQGARKTCFVLITFPVLSGPAAADYITNAMPEDVVAVLHKVLDKYQGK